LRLRRRGGSPRLWQIAMLLCLHVAALDAKEMAVTLPVILGVYELLYHRAESWRSRIVTIGAMGVITAAYVVGTTHGEESLVFFEAYKPIVSANSYLLQTRSFL